MGKIKGWTRLDGPTDGAWKHDAGNVLVLAKEEILHDKPLYHLFLQPPGRPVRLIKSFSKKIVAERHAVRWLRRHPGGGS
jgi:hypothetical protein